MAGRPTKLNQERHDTIVDFLRDGNFKDTAAKAAGIRVQTLLNWMERGEADVEAGNDDTPYAQLFEAATQAMAQAEADAIGNIRKAARDGDWRADAWYLERAFPKRYGKRVLPMLQDDGKTVDEGQLTYADLVAAVGASDGDEDV